MSPAHDVSAQHHPRRRFSQSFLKDQSVADAIVRAARLTGAETVLEIGPGLGVLTRRILAKAARVIAVEIDRDLARRLPESIPSDRLELIQMDALEFDPASLGGAPYRLVANLPYHITSPLLMHFLHAAEPPDLAVLMMQREVAERISAPIGQLSYLAVAIQSVATVETVRQVPPAAFVPQPKVHSTVLRLHPRPSADRTLPSGFLRFVRAGFAQPRKRLANSLAQGLGWPKSAVEAFLTSHDVADHSRPHELTIDSWRQLSEAWNLAHPESTESRPQRRRVEPT